MGWGQGDGPRHILHTLFASYLKWVPFCFFFANAIAVVVVGVIVTLEVEEAAEDDSKHCKSEGLGAEAKDNIFAQFSGVISIHAHAN